jgi:biopolymer transport protein ExbD/biopolymer transport protein TolR
MAFSTRSGGQTRTQTALADINITPLVDVVLVLLLIFMLTAPVLQSGIQVNVPKTKTVREITEQRMVLTIDKDQQVFLNDKLVNLNDLPNILRAQSSDTSKQVIYLRADQAVSFGAFATLMDAVKQAGITNVSIVTTPAENAKTK